METPGGAVPVTGLRESEQQGAQRNRLGTGLCRLSGLAARPLAPPPRGGDRRTARCYGKHGLLGGRSAGSGREPCRTLPRVLLLLLHR